MVGIAQLVSAPDCGSGGPGFESLYPPFLIPSGIIFLSKNRLFFLTKYSIICYERQQEGRAGM